MLYIVSGGKDSGKTTRLKALYHSMAGAAGFAAVKNYQDSKFIGYNLENLSTGTTAALARFTVHAKPAGWREALTHGPFSFSRPALSEAENIVAAAISSRAGALFLDEIGKLELGGRGLCRALRAALRSGADTYIAVRDTNIAAVQDYFRIPDRLINYCRQYRITP